jgi:hypothetical protein
MGGGQGPNWNPGDGLRQLSQNAGQGIGSVGNNFSSGAAALADNWNAGKANANTNWNGVDTSMTNGAFDPSKGTLGALAGGLTNGGDFNAGMDQIKGGLNQDWVNNQTKDLSNLTKNTLVGSVGALATGGDPFLGSMLGGAEGARQNMQNESKSNSDNANNRTASDQQSQQAQATQTAQQQQQQQQGLIQGQATAANQSNFNQQNSFEDALRAAALQRQGSKANANLAY